jgi:serine kinase of HPr protein (carbohydrate metabolism regulator)
MLVHGSCVGFDGAGVLLRAPPGGGKSDLALRLIGDGAVLVADDQVVLSSEAGDLIATAPAAIKGRIEVRGIGIVTMAYTESVALALVVDLVAPDRVERMPEPAHCTYLGLTLPRIALAPFEASTPAKLRLAVDAATRDSARRS